MQLEEYFSFLAPDDIRIRGTRVGIETVLYDTIYRSRLPEEIVAQYPSLTLEQVHTRSRPGVRPRPTAATCRWQTW